MRKYEPNSTQDSYTFSLDIVDLELTRRYLVDIYVEAPDYVQQN